MSRWLSSDGPRTRLTSLLVLRLPPGRRRLEEQSGRGRLEETLDSPIPHRALVTQQLILQGIRTVVCFTRAIVHPLTVNLRLGCRRFSPGGLGHAVGARACRVTDTSRPVLTLWRPNGLCISSNAGALVFERARTSAACASDLSDELTHLRRRANVGVPRQHRCDDSIQAVTTGPPALGMQFGTGFLRTAERQQRRARIRAAGHGRSRFRIAAARQWPHPTRRSRVAALGRKRGGRDAAAAADDGSAGGCVTAESCTVRG